MTNDKIGYTTVEQQIEKLKQQNLIIDDETFAKDMLTLCGYSNLIKSYRVNVVVNNAKTAPVLPTLRRLYRYDTKKIVEKR